MTLKSCRTWTITFVLMIIDNNKYMHLSMCVCPAESRDYAPPPAYLVQVPA